MTHFIHYWSPRRAGLAFSGQNTLILSLDNGWFKSLQSRDVVWIVTRDGDSVYLVLRFEVERVKPVSSHPKYAVGNSRQFRMVRALANPAMAFPPRAIRIPLQLLRKLRFDSSTENDRIVESGSKIFELDLAAMRRLRGGTSAHLEELWASSPRNLWNQDDTQSKAGGLFAPPEIRSKVEKAAVRHVSSWHRKRGWSVQSREKEGIGYDLECTKDGQLRCVEVKGSSGEEDVFVLTRGEQREARENPDFLIAIAHNALDSLPKVKFVTGRKLLADYCFEPLQFLVVRKGQRE